MEDEDRGPNKGLTIATIILFIYLFTQGILAANAGYKYNQYIPNPFVYVDVVEASDGITVQYTDILHGEMRDTFIPRDLIPEYLNQNTFGRDLGSNSSLINIP